MTARTIFGVTFQHASELAYYLHNHEESASKWLRPNLDMVSLAVFFCTRLKSELLGAVTQERSPVDLLVAR